MNMLLLERFATATPTTEGNTEDRDACGVQCKDNHVRYKLVVYCGVSPSVSKCVDPSAGTHSLPERETREAQWKQISIFLLLFSL